jgi:hypothetical protein
MPYTTKANIPEGFTDLSEKLEPYESTAMDASEQDQGERVHYPSLYFQNAEALKSLPKEGTAVIHFKKVMEKTITQEINGKSETKHCVELQINGIKAGEANESSNESNKPDDDDAIEKGLEAASQSTTDKD